MDVIEVVPEAFVPTNKCDFHKVKGTNVEMARDYRRAWDHVTRSDKIEPGDVCCECGEVASPYNNHDFTLRKSENFGGRSQILCRECGVAARYAKRKSIKPKYSNIPRNDPCPCCSGMKYKKCCLLKNPY